MKTARATATGFIVVIALGLLAGCTPSSFGADRVTPKNWVGSDLASVSKNDTNQTIVVYDLSKPVLGLDATYNGTNQGSWLVIVACEASSKAELAVGVVNANAANQDLLSRAAAGDYRRYLTECS